MCLTNESRTKKFGKDTILWKVFLLRGNGLRTIYWTKPAPEYFPANKKFADRKGYQVFATKEEAQRFANKLWTRYAIRKVKVKKGALYRTGTIDRLPAKGQPAMRVSSLRR